MDGYVLAGIVLFAISSAVVALGSVAQRGPRADPHPGAIRPTPKSWLVPALTIDAIAVALIIYGATR